MLADWRVLLVPATVKVAAVIECIVAAVSFAVKSTTFPFAAIFAEAVPTTFTKAFFAELEFARFPLRLPTIFTTFVEATTNCPNG